ncbi:MAG: alpha/beta hydrolase [Bacteroidota bacterium]
MQNDQNIDINGVNLSVQDSGTNGEPIIFIHPFPFNKSVWQEQFDFLKKTNRVITYDIRGFGNSTLDVKKSSIPLYAEDLIQLMDDLQIKKVIACGLSMGGYILLNAVERYPERFSAIILADTQCVADSKEEQQKRYDTIKTLEEKGVTDFVEGFINKAFSPRTLENNSELVDKMRQLMLSNTVSAFTSGLSAMAQREETCTGLKNLSIPALVISGKNDIVIQPTQSELLFNNIPGAKLEFIEQAGHLANVEQPQAFNKIISNFIAHL